MSNHGDSTQKKNKTPEEKHLDAVKGPTHHFVNTYDGGKCLWRGIYVYQEHSCSYRYQAIGRALEDNLVYNWPAYAEAAVSEHKIKTSRRETKKGGWYPKDYAPELNAPTENGRQWDITGDNFKYSTKPYWNQPHHIIPIGLLNARLSKLNEEFPQRAAGEVEQSLLEAGYNINHKLNMILLPMDDAISDCLHLPKHGGPNGKNNHKEYDQTIQSQLDKIIDSYREQLVDLKPNEHLSEQVGQAQKQRLERLSKRMYKQITCDCPRGEPGQPYTGNKSLESEALKYKSALERSARTPAGRSGGGT